MREKLKEFQNSPRSIIAAFSAAVLFFCTVFTRLILKTDDGHFLGILHRNGFTVTSWLHERYTTVSGRIVGEWLMINFLRLPLIFWKLFIAALIIYNVFSLPPVGLFRRKDRYKTEIYLRLLGAVGSISAMPQPVGVLVCRFVYISRSVRRPAYHGDSAHIQGVRRARESHGICRRRDCFCRRGISGAVLRRGARAAGDSADFFGISTQAKIPSIHSAPAERGFRRGVSSLTRTSRARSDGGGSGF